MTRKYTISKARQELSDIASRAEYRGERTILYRRNRPVAAVMPYEDYELLERLEDEADIRAAKKALREKGSISWEEVKKRLKL